MSRFIGSTMIIISTIIGAGILALPLVSSAGGFIRIVPILIGMWALTTLSGWMMVKASIVLEATSIADITQKTLGRFGQIVVWTVTLLFLYAVTAAYMSGVSSLLAALFRNVFHTFFPRPVSALLFSVVFGSIVSCGTRSTDWANRLLLAIKICFLLCAIILLLPCVNTQYLLAGGENQLGGVVCGVLPIFLCAFGFHTVIPSLYAYNRDNPKRLYSALVMGTTVPLVIYIGWLAVTLGVVPGYAIGNTVDGFLVALLERTDNKWVSLFITAFTNITMMVSFLGITLGLFDFLRDGLKRQETRAGRLQTALATFVPPLTFALCYPEGFLFALKYSAIFASLLMVVLPAVVAHRVGICNRAVSYIFIVAGIIVMGTSIFKG